MKKLCFLLIIGILISLACEDSNPIESSNGEDAKYYPLAVGNEWVYGRDGTMSLSGTQIATITGACTTEITGTSTHSDEFEVFIQEYTVTDTIAMYGDTIYTDSTFTTYVRVTDDGLYGYAHLTDTDSSWVIPFPLQNGATWDFSDDPPMTASILSMSANVTVTAGSFDNCLEMQLIWSDSGNIVTSTSDFAKNIGKLRNVYVQSYQSSTTTITDDLESYTIN